MCDYDWSYEEISSREAITRKAHECTCCMRDWPKGTRMTVAVGLTDGDLGRTYCCPVCKFALAQVDHAPLHFCWGHWWDGSDQEIGDDLVYEYIKRCLARGVTPSEAHAVRLRDVAGRMFNCLGIEA